MVGITSYGAYVPMQRLSLGAIAGGGRKATAGGGERAVAYFDEDSITMAGAAERLKVPLLQIYGGLDKASPPEHAYRVEKEVKGPTTTVVFENGVHVCNNLHHIARPLIADWLLDNLR